MNLINGRLNRGDYLIGRIFLLLSCVPILIMSGWDDPEFTSTVSWAVFGLLVLVITFFSATIGVRRFHDLNLPTYWIILNFVPIINLGVELYLLFKKGTVGENKFGTPQQHGFNLRKIFF